MHSVNQVKSKRKTCAIIIACLLNSGFLFFIFFLELHQNMLFNDLHTFEENIVLDILPKQESDNHKAQQNDETKDETNSNAGLMMRGTPDGTLPPTLFSDYVKKMQSPEQATAELLQDDYNATTHTNAASTEQAAEETTSSTNNIIEEKIDTTNPLTCAAQHELSHSESNKKDTLSSKTIKKRVSPKKHQKKNPTATRSLAQMTRTALNTAQSKGNAAIFSAGDKNKLPSELQLAEEQYWIKIEHTFYNASVQYQNMFPATHTNQTRRPLATVIIFYLPDGFIKSISLQHSSGDHNVDQAILTIFNEVQMLTPPLPKQLREAYGYERVCIIYC